MYTTDTPLISSGDKLFLVLNFHHFEPAISKVVQGLEPDFNTTSQYVVTVDDFLLRCLQNGSAGVLLYACSGTDFRCVGACQLKFKDLLSQTSNSRIHGSLQILDTQGENNGVVFANLEYYLWFKFPVASSLRLFKERCKAGTYLTSNNTATSNTGTGEREEVRPDGYNELKVTVLNCTGVKGKNHNKQPSPYLVYKFFNFEDRATGTVESSNSPQFNDSYTYPLTTDHALHRYLSQAVCQVHLFDDSGEGEYLGAADVPLIQLAGGLHRVGLSDYEKKPVYFETPQARREREEGENAALQAERKETKSSTPTALHVTFKLEDEDQVAEVAEVAGVAEERQQMNIEEVRVPKTEFMSFRSLEEHDRAMIKAGKIESPVIADVQLTADAAESDHSDHSVHAVLEAELKSILKEDDDNLPSDPISDSPPDAARSLPAEPQNTYAEVVVDSVMSESTLTSISEEISIETQIQQKPAQETAVASTPVTVVTGVAEPISDHSDHGVEELQRLALTITNSLPTYHPQKNEFDDSSSEEEEGIEELLTPATPAIGGGIQEEEDGKKGGGLNNTFFEEEPSDDDDVVLPVSSGIPIYTLNKGPLPH
eukprot:sb/3463223/